MPIKGLSDIRRLPFLGMVRIGEKVENSAGVKYPKAADHFLFKAKNEKLNEAARSLYGEEPKELMIFFPYDDEPPFDKVFPQYKRRFRAGVGEVCKGDGERAVEVSSDGSLKDRECPCAAAEGKSPECRNKAYLKFVINKFPMLGVWQIETGGYHAIVNINSALAKTKEAADKYAIPLSEIPFMLSLESQNALVEGKKKKIYVLQLRAIGKRMTEILSMSTNAGLIGEGGDPALEIESTDENEAFL